MGYWRCKDCGSTDILAEASGDFRGEGVPNKYGNIEDFDNFDIQDSKVKNYECMNCHNCSSHIEDIAEWVEE